MRIVIVGAGGHGRVVLDTLRLAGQCEIVGFLDPARLGQEIDGVPVLGDDSLLSSLRAQGIEHAAIGVGSIGDNRPRMTLFNRVRMDGFDLVNAVHPSAVLASTTRMGSGVAIMASAVINTGAMVGDNVIVNTGAIVEHDCMIGGHSHISPAAVLCGGVRVGIAAHIGAGATIREGVSIGDYVIVGAGAVVLRDVASNAVVVGVPARAKNARPRDTV